MSVVHRGASDVTGCSKVFVNGCVMFHGHVYRNI